MFVKGFNEKHDFKINSAPISYDDLQMAYLRLLEGKKDTEIFDVNEGDKRERRYMYFMTEYIQTGDSKNESTMLPTGRTFPKID